VVNNLLEPTSIPLRIPRATAARDRRLVMDGFAPKPSIATIG
jgi:hypothetical protein